MKKGEARVLKVKTFRNKMFKMFGKVRTVAIQDGRGLFLEDVCNAVGFLYDRTLHGFLEPDDVWYEAVRDDKGKDRIVALIDEPGLRMIVAEAHNMKAEVFGYWIRREVLTVVSWESDNPKESEERAKFRACVAKGMTATKKAGAYAAEIEISVNPQTFSGWKLNNAEHFINLILFNVRELMLGNVAINDWMIPTEVVEVIARAEMFAGQGLQSAKSIRQEDVGRDVWKLRTVEKNLRAAKRHFAEAKKLISKEPEEQDCIRTDELNSEWDSEWGER